MDLSLFLIWWLGTFALWTFHCNYVGIDMDLPQAIFMLLTWPLWVFAGMVAIAIHYPPQTAIVLWTLIYIMLS